MVRLFTTLVGGKGYRSYFIKVLNKDQTIIVLNNIKRGAFFNIDKLIELIN